MTSLSIGLVSLCGVSVLTARGSTNTRTLPPFMAAAEDSRYRVMGIKAESGNIETQELKGKLHKLRWSVWGGESREVLLTSAFNLN